MRSDLERRVAEIERATLDGWARARRLAAGIDRTAAAVRALVPAGPGVGTGTPPINVPCCPGVDLPASLTVRLPDGTTATLTHANGLWEGGASVTASVWDATAGSGVCFIVGSVATARQHPVYFRLACTRFGTANVFRLEALTPAAYRFVPPDQQVFYPARTVPTATGDANCRRAAYLFAFVGGTRVCRPLNLAFRVQSIALEGMPYAVNDSFIVYE